MDDFEALVSSFIEKTTADNEHPRAALISSRGVVRAENGDTDRKGSPAVVVVTNARLIFIIPDEGLDLQEWSVYYSDLAAVNIERDATNKVEVTTRDGVSWRCTLPNANPEVLDAVTRHLRWVDHVRTRLIDLEDRVEEAADEVRAHADDMNWDAAQETYRAVRTELDTVISMVQLTTPMADDTLAPELTDIERTLEEANVRLYIERAQSQLELGRYLVEHEDYDRAADVLERARRLHQRAAGQSDAVRRADEFAFGRQRELAEDLERLEWDLKAAAAEPIRQAQEAAIRARETDDPDATVEYWETALRRYDRILALDWWKEAQEAAEDIDDARGQRDTAARELVETRIEITGECWREGVRSHDRGETTRAIEQFEDALSNLERAHELAVEFDHDDADELAAKFSEIQTTVENLRASAAEEESDTGRSETESETGDSETESETGDSETESETGESPDQSSQGWGVPAGTSADRGETADSEQSVNEESTSDESDPSSEEPVESEAEADQGRWAPDSGREESPSGISIVRLQQETFTGDTQQDTDEWIPPSMSDIVEIETHHELTYDLDKIGLPEDVSARNDEDRPPGGNGIDN
jgi:tetratricopeptide (TPR) repeat protein